MLKKLVIFAILTAGVLVGASTLYGYVTDLKREATIARANADALRDTLTMFEDSVSTTRTLMQLQVEANQDSILGLHESLRRAVEQRDQTIAAFNTLRVEFDVLRDEFTSVTVEQHTEDPGEERATFEIAGPPVEGSLFVTYRPSLPWLLRTELRPSSFDLVYSIGCDTMRRALVNTTTPPWVRANPTLGSVTPDVCNAPMAKPLLSLDLGRAVWFGGGVVTGLAAYWLLDTIFDGEPTYQYPIG